MPRYHLHLRNMHIDASDPEGQDLPDLIAAHDKALEGIRSFIGHEAMRGTLDFRGQIDIEDGSGKVLEVVRFAEAFDIKGLGAGGQDNQTPPAR